MFILVYFAVSFCFHCSDFYKLLLMCIAHNLENLAQNKYHIDLIFLVKNVRGAEMPQKCIRNTFLLLKCPFLHMKNSRGRELLFFVKNLCVNPMKSEVKCHIF